MVVHLRDIVHSSALNDIKEMIKAFSRAGALDLEEVEENEEPSSKKSE